MLASHSDRRTRCPTPRPKGANSAMIAPSMWNGVAATGEIYQENWGGATSECDATGMNPQSTVGHTAWCLRDFWMSADGEAIAPMVNYYGCVLTAGIRTSPRSALVRFLFT